MKPVSLLALCGAALLLYGVNLVKVPIESDELLLYSSVSRAPHPFGYFLSDADVGLHVYRPLPVFVEWIGFRLFGVWALPGLLLSILLHAAAVALLVDVMRRVCPPPNRPLLPLLAVIALASPYTMSAATWIPDRATLFVAVSAMLLVRHLCFSAGGARPLVVAALSAAALFSKESGVLVPLMAAAYGWRQQRREVVAASAVVVAGYFGFRFAALGQDMWGYAESGVLFGLWEYDSSAELTGWRYFAMLVDNVLKHVVAVGLPIFGEDGDLLHGELLRGQLPWLMATAGLVSATAARPSRVQIAALLVIAGNAVIHAAVFRYRMLYLSQFALLVFVASSSALVSGSRRTVAIGLAAALVVTSVFTVERMIVEQVWDSYGHLHSVELEQFVEEHSDDVDPAIVADLYRLYAR